MGIVSPENKLIAILSAVLFAQCNKLPFNALQAAIESWGVRHGNLATYTLELIQASCKGRGYSLPQAINSSLYLFAHITGNKILIA